jgi:hypothetical protein
MACFFVVSEFELRDLNLLVSPLQHESLPQAFFCFSYFLDRVLHFLSKLAWDHDPTTYVSHVAVIIV